MPWDHPWVLKLSYIVLALVGGTLGYISRQYQKNEKINGWRLVVEAAASAFAGFLVMLVCQVMKLGPEWTGIVVGVCGWLGADATIRMLDKQVTKRLGVDKHDP